MKREEKAAFVTEMHERLQEARAVFLADFRGMSVAQDNDLRSKLTESGVDMKVVKNRLFARALADTPFEGLLDELLVGPNAVMLTDDVVSAAKTLIDYLKEGGDEVSLELKGGALGDTALSVEEIKHLATLPSRDELIAKFVGLLQTPLQNFTVLLNAPLRDFASVLRQLEQQKAEN